MEPSRAVQKARRSLTAHLSILAEEIRDLEARAEEQIRTELDGPLREWWQDAIVDLHLTGAFKRIPGPLVVVGQTFPSDLVGDVEHLKFRWKEAHLEAQALVDNAYEDSDRYWLAPDIPKRRFPGVSVAVVDWDSDPLDLEDWFAEEGLDAAELIRRREAADPWLVDQWERRYEQPPDGRLKPPPDVDAESLVILQTAAQVAMAEHHLLGDRELTAKDELVHSAVDRLGRWRKWAAAYGRRLAPGSAEERWLGPGTELRQPLRLSTVVPALVAVLPELDDPVQAVAARLDCSVDPDERWQLEWLAERWKARRRKPPAVRLDPPPSPASQALKLKRARDERQRREQAAQQEAADQAKKSALQRAALQAQVDAVASRLEKGSVGRVKVTTLAATVALAPGVSLRLGKATADGVFEWALKSPDGEAAGSITRARIASGELDSVLDAVGVRLAARRRKRS